MTFYLGSKSLKKLVGVHEDLKRVCHRAIKLTTVDFTITEGVRTPARQKKLVEAGASKTMKSRHLTGHAVDVAAMVGNEIRWDWPLYREISIAFKEAANELGVPIRWGGDWKSFKDGPHFELDRKVYP